MTTLRRLLTPRPAARGRDCPESSGGARPGGDRPSAPWSKPRPSEGTHRSSESRHTNRASGSADPAPAEAPESAGEGEELDGLGAAFLWRTMLGLDTDSDYEDENPTHMPGFLNEPAYSTVYETLMDKSPSEYSTMCSMHCLAL